MKTTRVARSLMDRVFGGVCGGLGAYLGINPWWLRVTFVVLTLLSNGVVALLYLILWWILPPDLTPDVPHSGRDLGMLLVGVAIMLTGAVVLARGMGVLSGPGGADLFWPGVVMIMGAALLLQQLRRG